MNDYDPHYIEQKVFARIGQKVVVINNRNHILVLQRSERSGGGGKWSIPGGALEYGEDPFEGIKRELKEETTIEVTHLRPFILRSYINSDKEFIVMVGYLCQAQSETVTLNWEHDAYKWVSKKEALFLELTTDGRYFIEHVSIN